MFTQLASGHSNHQIAGDLSLSTNTVANHIASILAKLHLENRAAHRAGKQRGSGGLEFAGRFARAA